MFETGFLGTRALMFMDIVTIYFAMLPFLLAFAIRLAVKGRIDAHRKMQAVIFVVTLLMVVLFEVGVRFSGGFPAFSDNSTFSPLFLWTFLIIHIIIALISVLSWIILIYSSAKQFKEGQMDPGHHKRLGKKVFLGLTITSVMGCMIYLFLFVY
jgi:putative membrane protein